MRHRLALTVTVIATAAFAAQSTAATKYVNPIDGSKVKELPFTGEVGQAIGNDATDVAAFVTEGDFPDRSKCAPPACVRYTFTYVPAKGVASPLMVKASWGQADVNDMDLTVYDSTGAEVASCGTFGGSEERVVIPFANLKPKMVYTAVVFAYQSVGDTITGKVSLPSAEAEVPDSTVGAFGEKKCGNGAID